MLRSSPPVRKCAYGLGTRLRVTPAMEAGIAGHIWTIEDLVGLPEA